MPSSNGVLRNGSIDSCLRGKALGGENERLGGESRRGTTARDRFGDRENFSTVC